VKALLPNLSAALPKTKMAELRAMASSRSGRRILKKEQVRLAAVRESYIRQMNTQLAAFDESLRELDAMLNPAEIEA
jgi:hypothetical protein